MHNAVMSDFANSSRDIQTVPLVVTHMPLVIELTDFIGLMAGQYYNGS
jgi:hypothetical protein